MDHATTFMLQSEELFLIAVDAVASKNPRKHITDRLEGDLTWTLVNEFQPQVLTQAIGALLNRAKRSVQLEAEAELHRRAAEGKTFTRDTGLWPVGGGQDCLVNHSKSAPATPSQYARPLDARRTESANVAVTPKSQMPTGPTLTELADKQAAAHKWRSVVEFKLNRLETVMVGGTPIGKCTVGVVRAWAEQRKKESGYALRDARFAMALVANLDSNVVIGDKWRDIDEVNKIYADAEAEYAA